MAFAQIFIDRQCPSSSFEYLEEQVAKTVGPEVYGDRYPHHADVDSAVSYARLATYMALKVEIDTEDLPSKGWFITSSGLCVPPQSSEPGITVGQVTEKGLEDDQRQAHFAVLAGRICESLAGHAMWDSGEINWFPNNKKGPLKRLGVLVARAEGAWHATYSEPE